MEFQTFGVSAFTLVLLFNLALLNQNFFRKAISYQFNKCANKKDDEETIDVCGLMDVIDVVNFDQNDFTVACEKLKSCSLDEHKLLTLYGLYKQGTIGDVNTPAPPEFDFVAYAKWKAWNTMQGRTKITAQAAYAYLVENWLEDGDAFGSNTGQFHSSSSTSSSSLLGPVQSKPRCEPASKPWEQSEAIFKLIADEDLVSLKCLISTGIDINQRNNEGLTPLHYAADRGLLPVVKLLVENFADTTLRDFDDQTPYDYSCICEHDEVLAFLEAYPR